MGRSPSIPWSSSLRRASWRSSLRAIFEKAGAYAIYVATLRDYRLTPAPFVPFCRGDPAFVAGSQRCCAPALARRRAKPRRASRRRAARPLRAFANALALAAGRTQIECDAAAATARPSRRASSAAISCLIALALVFLRLGVARDRDRRHARRCLRDPDRLAGSRAAERRSTMQLAATAALRIVSVRHDGRSGRRGRTALDPGDRLAVIVFALARQVGILFDALRRWGR